MKVLLRLLILVFSLSLNAQSYRVYFTDKGENASLLSNPYRFLSTEAIENKALRNTPIDLSDVPVSRKYLAKLSGRGLNIKMSSRWFNYALVEGENIPAKMSQLSFVKKVEKAGKYKVEYAHKSKTSGTADLTYGFSANQIEMVNGDYLHDRDQLGQGMTIAVIDGGFSGTQSIAGLDSLRSSGRLKGTYNFIQKDTNVYTDGSHGTHVLSIMAGNLDSLFLGTAIRANYWLLKSENQSSETPVEMDYWLAAAEFADSVGADIISSSLGYNTFDGGQGDLILADMDGNTALVTRAADMAAKKGLLVINSVGNEGNSAWGRMLAPADGDSVLAIGGVGFQGNYVSFASRGPTADGRIKPDVSAQAAQTAYLGAFVSQGNGTSFSCPIVSGMAACLWQTDPSRTNMEIFEAIRSTATHPFNPDNFTGYGIADFGQASWKISLEEQLVEELSLEVFPNPVKDQMTLRIEGISGEKNFEITVMDIAGQPVFQHSYNAVSNGELQMDAPDKAGSYLMTIQIEDQVYLRKIIK